MIGLRLDRLDPVVVQVLNLAAVAGPAATLPVLVAASGLDGDQLLDATDAAVTAGLLVEDGAGPGDAARPRSVRPSGPGWAGPVASTCTGASPAPSQQASERQSSPAMLAHHLLEAGSLVEREVARRRRPGRRPQLDRRRRLRGCRRLGRPRRRAGHRPDRSPRPRRAGAAALRHGPGPGRPGRGRRRRPPGRRAGPDDRRPDAARPRRRGLDDVAVRRRLRRRAAGRPRSSSS